MSVKKYKKGVATKTHIVVIYDNNSIGVYDRFENTKEGLREVANQHDFDYDAGWNTRQFGKKLIDEFSGGANVVVGGDYCIYAEPSGTIVCGKAYEGSAKAGLREIAEECGFDYDPDWNTQQFGKKMYEALMNM